MNKTVDGRCMECGLEVIPGEHDDQAAKMIRLHKWAKTTVADRDSAVFGYKQGQFSQAQTTAYYVDGKATALGLALDHALLDGAQEKGEWL